MHMQMPHEIFAKLLDINLFNFEFKDYIKMHVNNKVPNYLVR